MNNSPPLRTREFFAATAFFLALSIVFYLPLFINSAVFIFRDLYPFFLANQHAARELTAQGWPAQWNPFLVLGRPMAADIQIGMFYPLLWIARSLPEAIGINFNLAFHHCVAGLGMYTLVRSRGLTIPAALLSGALFSWGGFLISMDSMPTALQSISWIPWTLCAFTVWLRTPALKTIVAGACSTTLLILGGMPEALLYQLVLLGAIFLEADSRTDSPGTLKSFGALVLLHTVACLLAAVQVIPFLLFILSSPRASGLSAANILDYSLQPSGIFSFFIPRRFYNELGIFNETAALWEGSLSKAPWALSLYLGVALTLVPSAFRLLRARQTVIWCTLFFCSLALALGSFIPGYEKLFEWMPFVKALRYPEKFLFFCHFCLCFLSAYGLCAIENYSEKVRRWYSLLCLLSAAGLILAATLYTKNPQFFLRVLGHDLLRAGGLLLLLSLLFALTRVPVRSKAYLVVGLCMLDLLSAHRHLLPSLPLAEILSTKTLPIVQKQNQFPPRVYSNFLTLPAEIQDDDQWQFQKALLALGSGSFYGISNINAPSGVTLQDEELLQEAIHAIPKEKIIEYLGSLSVSVLPSSKALPYQDLELRKNSALKDVFVYDLKPVQPRYKLVDKLHTLPSQDAVRASLPTSSFGEAFLGSNPYTEDRVREVTPLSPQDSVTLTDYSPQQLKFRAELAAPALLVLNEAYHRGWSAQINGRDFPVLRANYFLRAVFLPAGRSEIVFSYATPGLLLGAFISIVTILGLAVALSKRNAAPKTLER